MGMCRTVKVMMACFFLATLCRGQDKQWDRRFGGAGDDYPVGAVQIADGRYVIGGSSASGISGDRTQDSRGGYDYWILILDAAGVALADYRFGGNEDDYLGSLLYVGSPGLNYIRLLGHTATGLNGDKSNGSYGFNDFWGLGFRLYTNNTLTHLGQYGYGGLYDEFAASMVALPDYYTLNGGSTQSPTNWFLQEPPRGGWDYLAYITAHGGGWVQFKRYGGSGNDTLSSVDVVRGSGGSVTGAILAGTSDSPISGDKSQSSRGGNDYWVVRVDTNGVKQWDRRFGGTGHEWFRVVRHTADGGFILGGHTISGQGGDKSQDSRGGADYWVVKIDAAGNKQWDRRFGGSGHDEFADLVLTKDGGYLLAGSSNSGADGDKTQGSRGGFDYWIVKIDAAGNKKWDRRFGGGLEDRLTSVQQTADGGFLLSGMSYSEIGGDKSQASRGGLDYWIVKVGPEPAPPPPPTPTPTVQRFDTSQPITGYTTTRWAFLTAWNLSTDGFAASSGWRNGAHQWDHGATDYNQWIARFVYDQSSMQTRALAWYYRQVHVQ